MIGCDPDTPDEWQLAVDASRFLLMLDSAQQYGLIEQLGAQFNSERCRELLKMGAQHGYYPASPEALCERFLFRSTAKQ